MKVKNTDIIVFYLILIFIFIGGLAYSILLENEQSRIEKYQEINLHINTKNKSISTNYEEKVEEIIKYEAILAPKPEKITNETLVLFDVPNEVNTDFKAFMDYRTITDETTKQWELQKQAYTDEYGMRKVDDYYCVALGSYYTTNVGDKFKVTLENENTFEIIIGDLKQDCHTDSKNQYTPVYDNDGDFYGANVVEFIIDDNVLHNTAYDWGTVSYYDQFKGNITKIERIEM